MATTRDVAYGSSLSSPGLRSRGCIICVCGIGAVVAEGMGVATCAAAVELRVLEGLEAAWAVQACSVRAVLEE